MKKYLIKYKIYLFIIIILISIVTIYFFITNKKTNLIVENEIKTEQNEIVKEEKQTDELIKVDIKGSVVNPGVYTMNNNDRVIDVITASGGLTKNADTSLINLAKTLTDEMVIKIYTKEEVKNMNKQETIIKYIETECVCEDITNDACINNKIEQPDNIETKISLNSANIEQLDSLPGIGESKAKDIINYRNTNGLFKTIEDIKNVSGIGDSLFEKIKDYITI